jgi:hypothetical protein
MEKLVAAKVVNCATVHFFDHLTEPIDANTIFPVLARIKHEGVVQSFAQAR